MGSLCVFLDASRVYVKYEAFFVHGGVPLTNNELMDYGLPPRFQIVLSVKITRLLFLGAVALMPFSSIGAENGPRKVVVIFTPYAEDRFERLAARSESAYRGAGYEVIQISPGQASVSELRGRIAALKNVGDFQVVFNGHGYVKGSDSSLDPDRFPVQRYTPGSAAHNAGGEAHDEQKYVIGSPLGLSDSTAEFNPATSVGVTDIRRMITDLQSQNPNASVTVHASNCYSGNLAAGLVDVPRTQVFASADPFVSGFDMLDASLPPQARTKDTSIFFTEIMQRELATGKNYLESYEDAFATYLRAQFGPPTEFPFDFSYDNSSSSSPGPAYAFPSNSLQEYVQGWCLQNPNALSTAATTTTSARGENRALESVRRIYEMQTKYLQELKTKSGCDAGLAEREDQENQRLRDKFDRLYVEQMENAIKTASRDEYRERIEQSLRETSENETSSTNSSGAGELRRRGGRSTQPDPRAQLLAMARDSAAFESHRSETLAKFARVKVDCRNPQQPSKGKGVSSFFNCIRTKLGDDFWLHPGENPADMALACSSRNYALKSAQETERMLMAGFKCLEGKASPNARMARMALEQSTFSGGSHIRAACQSLIPQVKHADDRLNCVNRFSREANASALAKLNNLYQVAEGRLTSAPATTRDPEGQTGAVE